MQGVLEYSTARSEAEANEFQNLLTFARLERARNVNPRKGCSTAACRGPIMYGGHVTDRETSYADHSGSGRLTRGPTVDGQAPKQGEGIGLGHRIRRERARGPGCHGGPGSPRGGDRLDDAGYLRPGTSSD